MNIDNKIYFDLASLAEAAYALFSADIDSKRFLVDAGFLNHRHLICSIVGL